MPIWPFGRRRAQTPMADGEATLAGTALAAITETTPHRFRIWVPEADGQRATDALAEKGWLAAELTVTAAEPDARGRPFDLAARVNVRNAAIQRPLHVLSEASVKVVGFEAIDLVTDLDDVALAAAVSAWATHANRGPHRHRLEVLAGAALLDRCLAGLAGADDRGRAAWRFATTCVAFNTEGVEATMLEAAIAARGDDAQTLLEPVIQRGVVTGLTGGTTSVPASALGTLLRRRGYVSERAAYLADLLPPPLPDEVVDALCDRAVGGDDTAVVAIEALARAAPTDRVHDTLRRVLDSDDPNPMAAALGTLAVHWPEEARPVWRRFLESRSIPLRWSGEQTLGEHGTAEDVPDAAVHLARIVRAKASSQQFPPRGADLIALLARYADHPDARFGLDDLTARWDRLGPDMRAWIEEHHPELQPAQPPGAAELPAEDPDEPVSWPPPSLERDGDAWVVTFEEGAAHSPARSRFEELAAASPGVEVLDGDREWLRVRIDAPESDIERTVGELWEASAGSGRG